MEPVVYHGSPVSGLSYLEPKKSTHGNEYVYGSYNKAVALFFLVRGNGDLDVVKGIEQGIPFLVERRCHIFEEQYDCSGSLYELAPTHFVHEAGLWNAEVVSRFMERVQMEWRIDSVYEELKQLEGCNQVKLYHYPSRPSKIPLDNRDLIASYLRREEQGIVGAVRQLLRVYPEFQEEVTQKLKRKS